MSTLNPKCKICNEHLSKDGIFITSLDPFYMMASDKKVNKNFVTIAYHAVLDFFLEEISSEDEKILEQNFYHTECAPEDILKLLPTKEKIKNFLYNSNVGNTIQVGLSVKEAKESRISEMPKKIKQFC